MVDNHELVAVVVRERFMGFAYLIRHARSSANQENILIGRSGRYELNEIGRQQVARLADQLCAEGIIRLRTSPLRRAEQTASILSADGQLPAAVVDENLVERDFGPFEGLDRPALLRARAAAALDNADPTGYFPPRVAGVEPLAAVYERMRGAMSAVGAEADGSVALVTHAGVIKCYLYRMLSIPEHVPRAFKVFQASYVKLKVIGADRVTVHEIWRNPVQ
jgi:broad specificity phosphatase PhoE